MALSSKELAALLSLLSEENLSACNLETLTATFHRQFAKHDSFRLLNGLVVLLQMRDLLPAPPQRLAAIFLLYEAYRADPSPNPFSLFFTELLQPSVRTDEGSGLSPVEEWFLCQLLATSIPRDLYKKTTVAIAAMDPSSLPPVDKASLVTMLQETELSSRSLTGMSCVLSDPALPRHHVPADAGRVAETIMCGADQVTETPFEPSFIRPLPPLYTCDNEVTWLNPTESQHSVQWDTEMCTAGGSETKALFEKACKDALYPTEQQQLSRAFESDQRLVHSVGLTPAKLPQLIEKNPTVAIDALLTLVHSAQIEEYLGALLKMEMSLHSMEVVNRLTTAVDLPPEFLHLYINNCIQRCRESSDKSIQNRLVRLVCVFLQSLIRNKIINVQDELVEIQTFCVENAKIKEANALFRLLKTLDNEQGAGK